MVAVLVDTITIMHRYSVHMLGVSLTSGHVVMRVNALTCFEEDIIMRSPARIDLSAFFSVRAHI